MASEMELPAKGRCTRYAPHIKCAGRRDAQAIGEFFYSFHHHGWVWGEDRMVSKLLRDEHKVTYVWTFCPWCSGALPDLTGIVERVAWVDPEPPKKADGEGPE